MNVAEHIESVLGELNFGWSDTEHGIQIIRFNSVPEHGIDTYMTLGLEKRILKTLSGKDIRQILIISAHDKILTDKIVSVLMSAADYIINSGKSVARGQVLGGLAEFIDGTSFHALYATNPSHLPEQLTQIEIEDGIPLIFVYFIPITESEVQYIQRYGWGSFEEHLEANDPDIWDLYRSSSV